MSTVKSKKLQVGTDASASNNFTIYQPSTPDGTLRIGVGNADSPTEVGRFTSAGYKPTTFPIFSAYQNSAQNVSTTTNTKLTIDTVTLDTLGDYDTSNYRYTPSIAGYYNIGARCQITSTSTAGEVFIWIYKNGSAYQRLAGQPMVASTFSSPASSYPMYMNGTTDYVELYLWQSNGGTRALNEGANTIYFHGHLIAQA